MSIHLTGRELILGVLVQSLRLVLCSQAEDQVQALLDKFRDLKEEFDRGVSVQTLGKVDAVHEVLLTNSKRTWSTCHYLDL